jgi:hypothetical protein
VSTGGLARATAVPPDKNNAAITTNPIKTFTCLLRMINLLWSEPETTSLISLAFYQKPAR